MPLLSFRSAIGAYAPRIAQFSHQAFLKVSGIPTRPARAHVWPQVLSVAQAAAVLVAAFPDNVDCLALAAALAALQREPTPFDARL